MVLSVMQLKDNIFSLNVASLTQSFPKAIQERVGLGSSGNPKDSIELCRLLRARCARVHHRGTYERNEIAPSHVEPIPVAVHRRVDVKTDGNDRRLVRILEDFPMAARRRTRRSQLHLVA